VRSQEDLERKPEWTWRKPGEPGTRSPTNPSRSKGWERVREKAELLSLRMFNGYKPTNFSYIYY
jgi:hypothetical protein